MKFYSLVVALVWLPVMALAQETSSLQPSDDSSAPTEMELRNKALLQRRLNIQESELDAQRAGVEGLMTWNKVKQTIIQEREKEYIQLGDLLKEQQVMSGESARQRLVQLLQQRSELNVQLAGLRSAQTQLQELRVQGKAERQAAYERELAIASKILLSRKQAVEQTEQMQKRGFVKESEVESAKSDMLLAESELESLKRQATDDSAAPYSDAVFSNSLELARVTAQLKTVSQEIDEMKNALGVNRSLEEVKHRAMQQYLMEAYVEQMKAEEQMQEAQFRLIETERKLKEIQEQLKTAGADDE